ncbi:hypothetical protein ABK040_010132 [Willaertia magna]
MLKTNNLARKILHCSNYSCTKLNHFAAFTNFNTNTNNYLLFLTHKITQQQQYNKTYFLGLDISSVKTGFSVLNEDGKVLECGIINTKEHNNNIQEYGSIMKRHFQELAQKYDNKEEEDIEWIVGAEDFMLRYNKNSSSSTITKLANCNTLTCYECMNELKVKKLLKFNVNNVRSFFQIKSNKKDIKKDVFIAVKHLLPNNYNIRINKLGKIHESNYDVTDSLLIGLFSFVKFHVCEVNFKKLSTLLNEMKDRKNFIKDFLSVCPQSKEIEELSENEKIRHFIENYETVRHFLFTKFKSKLQLEYTKKFNIVYQLDTSNTIDSNNNIKDTKMSQ